MMKKLMMTVGALAVAATVAGATAPAQAGYGGGVYFNKHVYVTYNSGCYWLKKKAKRAEYYGNWQKAEYWWDRYWACKHGYDY